MADAAHLRSTSRVLGLLTLALSLRWVYCLTIFFWMGDVGLTGVDSGAYIDIGKSFAGTAPTFNNFQILGSNTNIMPIATWLLAAAALFGGDHMPIAYVAMQGLIDTGTCFLIYLVASSIEPRIAIAALALAAVNPTQIVLSGLVYVDTPFAFFVAAFLLGACRWLRIPSWGSIVLIIVGLSGAAFTRVLIVPWAAIVPFLLLMLATLRRPLTKQMWAQAFTILVVFGMSLAPLYARNSILYGSWSLTSQDGQHLARWVVPLVWEIADGTAWERGHREMETRALAAGLTPGQNQFQQSRVYRDVALDELKRVGPTPIAKAWIFGAIVNMASPAILISPSVSHLPRTGFYATKGNSPTEKIVNFLIYSDNAFYSWIALLGILGTLTVRLIQLRGLVLLGLNRRHWPECCILGAWIAFILAVNGPIASPKYRLPVEPPLCVFFAAGIGATFRTRTA